MAIDPDLWRRTTVTLFKESFEPYDSIRVCYRHANPECMIRFIATEGPTIHRSSTLLREMISRKQSPEQLREILAKHALHPEILLEILSPKI
jgi:hypothetical protein